MSVYEQDARIISDAIRAMRARVTSYAGLYDYSRSRIDVDLRACEVYSYGRWFPLFRYIARDGRHPEVFVINGDSVRSGGWGNRSRTPEHQAATRRLIADTGAASLIVPFSALNGAGIDIDSIRPVRADHNWTETVTVDTLAQVPLWRRETYNPARAAVVPMAPDADGRYSWTEPRHRLGDCLFSAVRAGRRALYLSSFDMNESPALYFLAQVPRGAGARTVEQAIDALAPRAVHAAVARGIPVERQGDVFFIRTPLTLEELEARGIRSRARLTQWTRGARARRGETGYAAPLTADKRRALARYRRAEWLRITRDARTKLEYRDAPASGPKTDAGARKRWAKVRAADARDLELARARLRAVTLGPAPYYRGRARRYGNVERYMRSTPLQLERKDLARAVRDARERLETIEERAARNARGRAAARDAYRAPFTAGPAALVAWRMAGVAAWQRFYPAEHDGPTIERRREKVRRALAIYGTAHAASEVFRSRAGAVYVRGTVRHVPDLEPGRRGDRDHRALELGTDGALWLAVRNTVPRSDTRRRA